MKPETRVAGWREVERVELQGEPALAQRLREVLEMTGREDRLTHGFHTYPAGLHPDAARTLLEIVGGTSVFDPFCGGGTVLVEAMTLGRAAVGCDVSPVANLVARTRTLVWQPELISRMRSWGRRIADMGREWTELPHDATAMKVREWYEAHVGRELEGLRHGIGQAPEEVRLPLWCAFSSILIKVSLRASDTSQQKVLIHREPGTTAILFHKKVRELGRRLEDLAASVPPGTPPAEIWAGDARSLKPSLPVDAIVTSPPYPAVYDYVPLQALRVAWMNLDDEQARAVEIGPRRAFRADRTAAMQRWRRDLGNWTRTAADTLRPGGRMAVVIGDGNALDTPVDSLSTLIEEGRRAGFVPVARASGDRMDLGSKVPRREHVLLLERK